MSLYEGLHAYDLVRNLVHTELRLALSLTPLMRTAALQLGIVDQPDGKLKNHGESVPYLSGIAVFTAFLFTVGILSDFGQETLGLVLSGSIALMVGLIDDFGMLTPYQKLLGETLAALVLVTSGMYIKLIVLPIWIAIPFNGTLDSDGNECAEYH